MKTTLRSLWLAGLLLIFLISACGVRPQYKTAKGKKKNRYYNSIQYQQAPFKAPNR